MTDADEYGELLTILRQTPPPDAGVPCIPLPPAGRLTYPKQPCCPVALPQTDAQREEEQRILHGDPAAPVPPGVIHSGPGKVVVNGTEFAYQSATFTPRESLGVEPQSGRLPRRWRMLPGNGFLQAATKIRARTPAKVSGRLPRRTGR